MKAVNLIPNEQRPAGTSPAPRAAAPSSGGSAFGAYLVLGILAFAVAASAMYVLTTNSIKTNKAELARVDQQAQVVGQQASSLQSFADFKTLSDARVSTVHDLAASRFDWQQALDDVSRALPSDVYIKTFDGTTTSISGGGGSSIRGAVSAPAIELTGCTRNQTSVARLMSSLRDVRGVTRVSLSKSEAQDTASTAISPAAVAAPTTPDGKKITAIPQPCPKGAPPTFDMVVFFERAAISQNAVPNAAAGPTTGPTGAAGPTGPTGSTGASAPATGATQPTSSTSTTP